MKAEKQKVKVKLHIENIENNGTHIFIDVKLNKIKAKMIVDTGASKSVLDLNFLKNNHLFNETLMEGTQDEAVGIGAEKIATFLYEVKNFSFGKTKLKKMEMVVLDLTHINQSYELVGLEHIDAILGGDFLEKHEATISYKKSELSFYI